jgi:predicted MFS family arabinose efflux permease
MRWLVLFVGILLTFHLVTFTWIFFVITDFRMAFRYIEGLLQFTYAPDPNRLRLLLYGAAVVFLVDIPETLAKRHEWLVDRPWLLRAALYSVYTVLLVLTWTRNYEPFIYFQF